MNERAVDEKEVERDERGRAWPPRGSSFREIARHYFFDVMAAEDQNLGCTIDRDPVYGGPTLCCQWRNRQPCGECAGLQAEIENYAIQCIEAALRERGL